MKILIIGAGRMGNKIIKTTAIDNNEIVVIDNNEKIISDIEETSKVKVIFGNALNKELLKSLKIENFDFIICATDSDKVNILVSTLCKNLGAKYTICRINQADSIDELLYLRDSLGIDFIINPDYEAAISVENMLKENVIYQTDSFGKGKIEVTGHSVNFDRSFVGKKISEIGELSTVLVVAIQRNDELIIPNGESIINSEDYLYIMGLRSDILNFKNTHFTLKPVKNMKKILIVGSGGITKRLISVLKDHDITVIEEDIYKYKKLRKIFPNVLFINKEIQGAKFFNDLEIEKYDLILALTDNDELNIVLGLMASKYKAFQTMIKIENENYTKILDGLNLSAVLNPLNIASNKIIKKIRYDKGISIYLSYNGQAEVLELKLFRENELIGKSLQEIELPRGVLVGGIIRSDGSAVIPRGQTIFKEDDTLVVFCKNENKKELESFISGRKGGFFSNIIY